MTGTNDYLLQTQCARTDLNKRFLPKPMTTTGWKLKGDPLRSQNHDELKSSTVGPDLSYDFAKIKKFQKFSDHSKNIFCFTIPKKLNKSCSLENFFFVLKKNIVSLKKTLEKKIVSGTQRGGFQFIMILTP